MNATRLLTLSRFLCASFVVHSAICCAQDAFHLVDPMIGTANDGQTVPQVGMPFAMTGFTPETRSTEDKCIAPFYDKDKTITGFRASHWMSGSCTQDYGSVTLMPITGVLHTSAEDRASNFDKGEQVSSPAYYSVTLQKYRTKVEVTGGTRAGVLRITFPAGADATLVLQPNAKAGEGSVTLFPERGEIVGSNPAHRIYQGLGESAGFSGYFVIRFDKPLGEYGTWCDAANHAASTHQQDGCKHLGAYVALGKSSAARTVIVRVGTSFTSIDEARRNLDEEQANASFDDVLAKTQHTWEEMLHRIEVQGGAQEQRRTFYTALYHSLLLPRIASDADGSYNGFAQSGPQHMAHGNYYDDYSMWDTFRALHPLLTIIDPAREQEMVQSLVLKGEQGTFLPIFPAWNNYTSEMIGDHAVAVIADAYVKGLRGFDVASAYRLILKNATVTPPEKQYKDGLGRRALQSYTKYGYIPLEDHVLDAFHKDEQVSRTLEYAYDDFLASRMAADLGHVDDAAMLAKRSGSWRNVIDPATNFARGRHADGTWVTPFDPAQPATYVTESDPWIYSFFVPQDVAGLIRATGGNASFVARLDGLFDKKLYDQGNEPSHHIAYLYDYAGDPARTQMRLHGAMKLYGNGAAGLPGNDDAGQMSAWYVLGALGFYPVCPGVPSYAIGTPLFPKVTVHQPNGNSFTVQAEGVSADKFYIHAVTLNGKVFPGFLLSHENIVRGGTLHFEMTSVPPAPQLAPTH